MVWHCLAEKFIINKQHMLLDDMLLQNLFLYTWARINGTFNDVQVTHAIYGNAPHASQMLALVSLLQFDWSDHGRVFHYISVHIKRLYIQRMRLLDIVYISFKFSFVDSISEPMSGRTEWFCLAFRRCRVVKDKARGWELTREDRHRFSYWWRPAP